MDIDVTFNVDDFGTLECYLYENSGDAKESKCAGNTTSNENGFHISYDSAISDEWTYYIKVWDGNVQKGESYPIHVDPLN